MRKNKTEIKIPKDISLYYCRNTKILLAKSQLSQKSIHSKLDLKIIPEKKIIQISPEFLNNIPNKNVKKLKSLQGSMVSQIKQLITEVSTPLYKKLNIIGIGYKAFYADNLDNKVLMLKLGYSHPIYFYPPSYLKTVSLNLTKIYVVGTSYQNITLFSSKIRSFKKPEPYKGKGILYENEKIKLKEGKKN